MCSITIRISAYPTSDEWTRTAWRDNCCNPYSHKYQSIYACSNCSSLHVALYTIHSAMQTANEHSVILGGPFSLTMHTIYNIPLNRKTRSEFGIRKTRSCYIELVGWIHNLIYLQRRRNASTNWPKMLTEYEYWVHNIFSHLTVTLPLPNMVKYANMNNIEQ